MHPSSLKQRSTSPRRHARARLLPATLAALGALALGAACAHRSSGAAGPAPRLPDDGRALAPDAPLRPADRAWVERTLAGLTLRQRVGQMVSVWVLGDFTNAEDPAFVQIRQWIVDDGVGGILMSLGSPGEVATKIAAMQHLAHIPLLVGADVEPGLGRLEGGVFAPYLYTGGSATILPSPMAIAATGRDSNAYVAGRLIGEEARAIGIRMDYAPDADVNNNPNNPVINVRSFGEDPAAVARLTSLFVRGLQGAGVAATAKHFPVMATPRTTRTSRSPSCGATARGCRPWSSCPSAPRSRAASAAS